MNVIKIMINNNNNNKLWKVTIFKNPVDFMYLKN